MSDKAGHLGAPHYDLALTYGTFDLFHYGHLMLLKRLKEMAGRLIVGVSTDEFNKLKGKTALVPFEHRIEIVASVRYVDGVFPESAWDQKADDIQRFGASIVGMGNDWQGKFDQLRQYCNVVYLPRTDGVSSSGLREELSPLRADELERLITAIRAAAEVLRPFE